MSSRTRTLYAFTMVLVFLIGAPLIALYSLGYRFDLRRHRIFRTGSIAVATYPRGAWMVLDGQRRGTAPGVIRNVLPGDHVLRLVKSGYEQWTKPVNVQPRQTSLYQSVLLVRTNSQLRALGSGDGTTPTLSRNGSAIAWIDPDHHFASGDVDNLAGAQRGSLDVQQVLGWSPDNRYAVATDDQRLIVHDHITRVEFALTIPETVTRARWNEETSSFVYLFAREKTYEVDLVAKHVRELPLRVFDLLARGSTLWTIELAELRPEKRVVNVYRLPEYTLTQSTETIDSATRFLLPSPNRLVMASDSALSVQINAAVVEHSFPQPIANAEWSNEQGLLVWSDSEVWVFPRTGEPEALIGRYPGSIRTAAWVAGWPALIVNVDGELRYLELDSRGQRYNASIPTVGSVTQFNMHFPKLEMLISTTAGFTVSERQLF